MAFCSHTATQSPYIYTPNTPHDYREITISIVNGVDISFVSPELYENLLPYIDQYILKFQDRNDISSVNRLKFCRDYIYQYPERERIAKILTKRKSDPPPEPLPFTPDELDAEIERLLSLKKINTSNVDYSQKEIDQLLIEMRNRRLIAADEENFDLADRLAFVSSKLSSLGAICQIRKIKIDHADELKHKLEETKQIYNDLNERWKNIQINFKEETTQELNQMKETQKKERIKLEKKKNGPIPPKYRKHSQQYLNLKQEEKMLVTAKRFDEATVIQQRVRAQEELEDQMIRKEWLEMCDRDLKKLIEKHKKQIKVREMNIKKEKNNIERTKKNELDALKNKITFLEKQIYELEQFGTENTEKSDSSRRVTTSNTNEIEKEDKNSEATNFNSYDIPDTEEKSKLSIVYNDTEDDNSCGVFFTENTKTEVDGQANSNNEEEENNEQNIVNTKNDSNNDNNEHNIDDREKNKKTDDIINDIDKNETNENIDNTNDESNGNTINNNNSSVDKNENNEIDISNIRQNDIINDKSIDQTEGSSITSSKFEIHPPQENESQKSGYKRRNRINNLNSYHQDENDNANQDQNSNIKIPNIVSAAYFANSTTSLPRLPNVRKARKPKKKLSGPETFRQRALLNRQLYCGKTLLSQHEKNQKDQLKQKRRKQIANNELM